MTDDDLRELLAGLERPADPGMDIDARVERRMLEALRNAETQAAMEVDGPEPAPTKPVMIELQATDGPQPKELTRRLGSRTPWFAVAAAVVVLALVSSQAFRSDEDEFDSSPASGVGDPGLVNVIGYREFRSATYSVVPADGEFAGVVDRPGLFSHDSETGETQVTVRRLGGGSLSDIDLTVLPNGAVVVPIEFLDPPSFGGVCRGGEVVIGPDVAPVQTTRAQCGGSLEALAIEVDRGSVRAVEIEGRSFDAVPVEIVLAGPTSRTVALWFVEGGLVQIDLPDALSLVRNPTTLGNQEDS